MADQASQDARTRQHLELGQAVQALGLELIQNASGITSRASPQDQAREAMMRLAACYAVARIPLRPVPPPLAGGPADVAVVLTVSPEEIEALATRHEELAAANAAAGNDHDSGCYRERARQLREMLEPAP